MKWIKPLVNGKVLFIVHAQLRFMNKIFLCMLLMFATLIAKSQFNDNKPRLNHIAVYVVDLKISTAFYKDIIGLDTIPEPFHDGKHTWFSVGVKSHLHV